MAGKIKKIGPAVPALVTDGKFAHLRNVEPTRVFDILDKLRSYAPKTDILNAKVKGEWVHYSVDDFVRISGEVAASLLALGLQKGSVVGIMAGNMPQWNFVDYGAQQVAMPTAPLFPTISSDDLRFILNHCEAKILFISDRSAWQKLAAMESELPHLQFVFSFVPIDGVRSFEDFLAVGREGRWDGAVRSLRDSVDTHDLFTILYTSGTTGQPKGVMLSHYNLLSNVYTCRNIAPFTNKWRALSFLPLNHVYERFLNTMYLYQGVSIYYAESFETIGDNCREIHPHLFVAVPRVLERVLERIMSAGEKLSGMKRKIFDWSVRLAQRYELNAANGFWYEAQRRVADRLVYSKWRAAVGGEVVIIVSGGAALNPRIERVFACAGLTLLQGYGLTETCVVVAVNRINPNDRKFGTVGLVVDNTKVRIDPADGEILMQGPSLMLGYYKNATATAEAIDSEGWFHTGDIGEFVEGKFLKITDRKKELFKSSAGKYISPVAIENRLKESRFIEQCMVVGEGQKFVSALIVPNAASIEEYFARHGGRSDKPLESDDAVISLIADHVRAVNASVAPHEQLKRVQILSQPWTVAGGEITPKLSLRRKIILEKNRDVLKKIFGQEG